jgi:hypothetical protein
MARPDRIVPAVVCALLLVPQLLASRESKSFLHLGPPRLESGDEPHYFVILESMLEDLDLELSNQYRAAREGGPQAGARFAGRELDEHTVWFRDGRRLEWASAFARTGFDRDAVGHPLPRLLPGAQAPAGRVYSQHPYGQALLFAPLLFPLRGTTWVEPAALFLDGLAVMAAFLIFRRLLRAFTSDERAIDLCSALAFLGTPVWHYGRTLFCEPLLLLLVVAAAEQWIARGRAFAAGALFALAVLVKPVAILLAVPFGVDALTGRRLRAFSLLVAPILVSVVFTLAMNHLAHGSIFRSVQVWKPGHFISGAVGLLASWRHGLLVFAPVVVLAAAGWAQLAPARPRESLLLLSSVALWFCLHAAWITWDGGWCFGPRFLVPVLPFICVGLVAAAPILERHPRLRACAGVVAFASLLINALGAIPYWQFWNEHPFVAIAGDLIH